MTIRRKDRKLVASLARYTLRCRCGAHLRADNAHHAAELLAAHRQLGDPHRQTAYFEPRGDQR